MSGGRGFAGVTPSNHTHPRPLVRSHCICDNDAADGRYAAPNAACHFHGTGRHAQLWQMREQVRAFDKSLTKLIEEIA